MAWEMGSDPAAAAPKTQTQTQAEPKTRAGPKANVMIAIPHRLGDWTAEFTEQTYIPLKMPNQFFDRHIMLCRTASISAARNMLVQAALKGNYTHIFFLDVDVLLKDPVQAIQLLLTRNEPIVSGMYRRKTLEGYQWCIFNGSPGNYVPVAEWTGNWITVDVVGMGCCLIKTEVFRKVPAPWFVWDDPNGPSEDFVFCESAKKHGYRIHVFTEVQAAHLGMFKLMPDGSFKTPEV